MPAFQLNGDSDLNAIVILQRCSGPVVRSGERRFLLLHDDHGLFCEPIFIVADLNQGFRSAYIRHLASLRPALYASGAGSVRFRNYRYAGLTGGAL